ncbi:hypothetical protein ANCCEY_13229 [Ancylostoma ceylanicum]|uniref:Uncharacterized protein n=1 Tax=Ancylostoma ceylanicum TaxID=53326 RepID=A0A0D6LCV5_9BILA|nr:hypothetical protein ANCCEY_13229 [Ancylostoma ceylanicum]
MNSTVPPYIAQWFQELPVVYIVFIGVCACVFIAISVATAIMVWRIHYYVPNEYVQADLYFIVLVPFIVSSVCLIGNIIPRAAPVTYAVGLVKKVRRLTYFVRQSPIVRVVLQVAIVILGVEGISDQSA